MSEPAARRCNCSWAAGTQWRDNRRGPFLMSSAFTLRAAAVAARRSMALMCLIAAVAVPSSTASGAPSENRFVLVGVADEAGHSLLGLEREDFTLRNEGVAC